MVSMIQPTTLMQPTALVVEDNFATLKALERFIKKDSTWHVSCVTNAQDARQALTNQEYCAWNPATQKLEKQEPAYCQWNITKEELKDWETPCKVIFAMVFDNCFPEEAGGHPEENKGIETLKNLGEEGRVSDSLKHHCISHSSDSSEGLKASGCFREVVSKPGFSQIKKFVQTLYNEEWDTQIEQIQSKV